MDRRFGVEVEFILRGGRSREVLARKLNAAGIPTTVQSLNHATCDEWKLVTDSSCGYELVSPILEGEAGIAAMKKAMEVMSAYGADVNRSCGLHVHFDASNLSIADFKSICAHWSLSEYQIFDRLVPPSRRGSLNNYCRSSTRSFAALFDCDSVTELHQSLNYGSRYRKLNLGSYFRHGTIEIRHFGGTIEGDKAEGWVRLQNAFINYCLGKNQQDAIAYRALSASQKLNNIVNFSRPAARIIEAPSIPDLKIYQLKEAVYRATGCATTKELKRQFNIDLDLRYKASWKVLYLRFVANSSTAGENATSVNTTVSLDQSSPSHYDLLGWVNNRVAQLGTAIAA